MKSKNVKQPKQKSIWIISIAVILMIAIIGYLYYNPSPSSSKNLTNSKNTEPIFIKEGSLWFISKENADTLRQVAIEIADDENTRAKGLMHRSSMADTQAMLFIFEKEARRSFWMKNTPMSLDILYVNKAREIITIQKHTEPYSESSIPSIGEALYVVETIAGFCDNYQITEGDLITFIKD